MFIPTNDPEDIYFMDPYSSLPPLNLFEFDDALLQFHDPAWRAENIVSHPPAAGAGDEPTSASNKMVLSKEDINKIVEEENARNSHGPSKQVSRKRSSKADRHSKIPTKHGLRDRRMRLSLDVARQFFKLQDMLIFDKPSKTVKWLLLQAKSAIEELKTSPSTDAAKSGSSSTSEGEFVESAIEEEVVNDVPKAATTKGKSRKTRKNTLCPAAKELRKKTREKARERAKERTQQKNQSRLLNDPGGCLDDIMNLYRCHLRPNGALELGDEPVSQTHTMKPSLDVLFEIDQDQRSHFGTTEGFIGSSSIVATNRSPLMSLNYHQEDDTFQANTISEFQFHGTSRESYNPNLGNYWY